jgi:hypothetical protein
MAYCSEKNPEGWRCILKEAHEAAHLSLDNQRVWKGTPGFPIIWETVTAELTREQSDELNPTLTTGEINKQRPKGVLVGDLCDVCGQVEIVRESACRTRCMACGAIDGGCG